MFYTFFQSLLYILPNLLTGEFNPLTFKIITDKEGLTSVVLVSVFYMPYTILSIISYITVFFYF